MEIIDRFNAKTQGRTRYYLGFPCIHGHNVERLVSNGRCVECSNVARTKLLKARREADPVAFEARRRGYLKKNPERHARTKALWNERWYDKNKIKIALTNKEERRLLKIETMTAYGGICACCGEGELEFLTLDHVYGGGTAKRRESKQTGSNYYNNLKRLGFPQGELRVLCFNCNCAIGLHGYCPHEHLRSLTILSCEAC